MTEHSRYLIKSWAKNPISRRSLLGAAFVTSIASTSLGRAFGATNPVINQILGRPTNNSIAISVLSSQEVTASVQYSYSKSSYSLISKQVSINPETPSVIELISLKPNTKIYYRIRYKNTGSNSFSYSKQSSFMTQRTAGESFSFSVQGDTHPERAGKMFNSELYYVTMANIAKQQPDFHILLGDDFSIDPLIDKGGANQSGVQKIYKTHRDWLSTAGNSVPIFLVNGNHEQAAAYLLDGTKTNPAVLAGNARLKYFPLPAPDIFYSGDTSEIANVGLPRDYYAWTWSDALFVTIDPYWHSKNVVDNVAGVLVAEDQGNTTKKVPGAKGANKSAASDNGKTKDLWSIGIGDEQYAWLKKTLQESKAKYKFVFAHHVMGTGRGGVEVSTNYEWGGKDPGGNTTFAKERPNWDLPIHDLMVKNNVSIFFQGHDHIFCTQERDGLIYQSMPNPADDTFTMFNESAYKSGVKAANSGHVRVSVSPSQAKVEYFLAARPKDVSRKNMTVAHSYIVKPKV